MPENQGVPAKAERVGIPGWVWPASLLGLGAIGTLLVLASRQRPAPALPTSRPSPYLDPVAADALDLEAAARMLASENPRGSEALKREELYTQLAQAKRHRQSLYFRITGGADFGPQNDVRPVSTERRATALDYALARTVLGGAAPPAQFPSARKFFEPAVQNAAFAVAERARKKHQAGQALTAEESRLLGYRKDADAIRRSWSSEGAKLVGTLEGVEFWT